jgi:hypothetical protein
VSTLDQNTDRQLAGIDLHRTFKDKASGKDIDRPELAQMMAYRWPEIGRPASFTAYRAFSDQALSHSDP